MTQGRPPIKRRNYFVKKKFQSNFIIKFCLVILVGVAISTGLLFLFSQGSMTSSFQHSRLIIKSTAVAIMPAAIYTNLITLGLITVAAIFVTLFVSHKLAGPLFRFEKELREIGSGNLKNVIFLRKEDQITDMADELNKMTESLHGKVLDVRTSVEDLQASLSGKDVPDEIVEGLEGLHQKIDANFKI